MKQLLCLLLLLSLLMIVGCADTEAKPIAPNTPAVSEETEFSVPQELPGVWSSADEGQLMLTETITFDEDGNLTVSGTYQGDDAGTIYGSYRVEGNKIICSITGGTEPFQVTYSFRIDGRELILTDAEGDARYLRTS